MKRVRQNIVFTLGCRMLHTRAQRQLQAIAQAAQMHGKREVAVNARICAPYQFLFGGTVVHGKGIQINRGVATGRGTEVNGHAIDGTDQQFVVHLRCQIEPGSPMDAQALTHKVGVEGTPAKPRARMKEGGVTRVLDGVESFLPRRSKAR